jgi:N-acetylglucosaminyldiphosphoundecaprenol N-acetyl-beta-D-mannosaminyltransferase
MMNWLAHTDAPSSDVLRVNMASLDQILLDLKSRLEQERGFSVATLNLDHMVKLRDQPDFRTAYLAHSHITADGNPIVWLSRLAGEHMTLVPGSDLLGPVIELAVATQAPVALYGSTETSLARTVDALRAQYPGIIISTCIAPEMGFDPEGAQAAVDIEILKASGTRLCLIALGAPKQERFAARAQTHAPQIGFLSIGAGLDFISGYQRRAPKIVRLLAVEWLWRLMLSPARLARRYIGCFAILPSLVVTALKSRWSDGRAR